MDFWQEVILAFIQGLLEWLPVSSEGFLLLFSVNIFHESEAMAFRLALYFHLGTGLAVLVKYWRHYWNALTKDRDLLRFLVFATAATGIFGIPLYFLLNDFLSSSAVTGLILTGLIGLTLIITGTLLRMGKMKATDRISFSERSKKDEILLGMVQGLSILPGISRSGSTVTYLLLRGYKREDAFYISFLISLPAIIGGVIFDFLFSQETSLVFNVEFLLIILITAVVGYVSMDILLRMARKLSFDIICFFLGGITLVLVIFLSIF